MPAQGITPAPGLPTLKKGMVGGAVPLLAAALRLQRDVFDDALDGAVRDYQREHGLVVDGIVGPKTWGSIIEEILVCDAAAWRARALEAEEKLTRVREIIN
ncbi:MAG: peptidoglycan-binding protein [Firmicutes bacterium]|nr:peptidoglycan-binding protein [Bacillota bacterium]